MNGPARPLTASEASKLFEMCGGPDVTGLVLAVSGGPDSMALMHLFAQASQVSTFPPVCVGTVDHGLRAESASEAKSVEQTAIAAGIPAAILVWRGEKPEAGLPAAARDARYALLAELARSRGASHIVTAHTLDDQAETLLMRLSKGSGLAGLVGMRARVKRDGVTLVRPFLGIPKARLLATCAVNGWPFFDDPSNQDTLYARPRWRRLMPMLAAEGLDAARLARLAQRAASIEDALTQKAREAYDQARVWEAEVLVLDGGRLAAEPLEIRQRLLALALIDALVDVNAKEETHRHWQRLARLERATEKICNAVNGRQFLRMTLAGVLITVQHGRIMFNKELLRRRGRAKTTQGLEA